MLLCFQFESVPSDPVEAEKQELMKMKTLERRARMSELQRFRKAQVSPTYEVKSGSFSDIIMSLLVRISNDVTTHTAPFA